MTTTTICSMQYQSIVYNQIMWTCDPFSLVTKISMRAVNITPSFGLVYYRKNNVLKKMYTDHSCPLTSSFVNMTEVDGSSQPEFLTVNIQTKNRMWLNVCEGARLSAPPHKCNCQPQRRGPQGMSLPGSPGTPAHMYEGSLRRT